MDIDLKLRYWVYHDYHWAEGGDSGFDIHFTTNSLDEAKEYAFKYKSTYAGSNVFDVELREDVACYNYASRTI